MSYNSEPFVLQLTKSLGVETNHTLFIMSDKTFSHTAVNEEIW